MKVKEVADLVGTSVRTLHHYDEIGLLTPDKTKTGYRIYSQDHLATLQQILFFRELDFPLKKIKEIINRPTFDRKEALVFHKNMLLDKREKLDQMIRTVEQTIQHMEGEMDMTNEEQFVGFDFTENKYEEEARKRWGDEAVDATNAQMDQLSTDERKAFADEFNGLFRKLAEIRHERPDSKRAQDGIRAWYERLNEIGSYSLDAFKGLGQLYVTDSRFTKNMDQFGEGLAKFMCEAMAIYADRHKD